MKLALPMSMLDNLMCGRPTIFSSLYAFYLLQCVFISLPDLETATVASYSVTFVQKYMHLVRIAMKRMRGGR